jgi:Phage tail tube protein
VREVTQGTTPASPRMRTMRMTGESLAFAPTYIDSAEIRADRMLGDPVKNMQSSAGAVNFELSYPTDNTPISEIIRSAMLNVWVNTPTFFNDGTADSVITDAGTVANTYAVVSGGAAVVLGHLVRATGFTQPANNQIFRAASSTATTIVGTALTLTAEAAPNANAKLKVVGFQGASADITATSTGLGSTALDFTTLGLSVGQWVKIGGTVTGFRFATAALNDFARISAIAAHALTLDNLPATWTTDTGTGKTINVYFGDEIKNGITPSSVTIERGFLGQTVPTYIVNTGMEVNTLVATINSKANITSVATFMGMGGGEGPTTLSSTPDAATTNLVMAANANVGRLGVNGSQLVGPNWAQSVTFSINNNLRTIESVDSTSPVAIREGECTVTGDMNTYFGSDTELAAFYAGTTRPINTRVAKANQAIIFQVPRATYKSGGNPSATAKNTDVMAKFSYQASVDTVTNAHIIIDRFEYYEI